MVGVFASLKWRLVRNRLAATKRSVRPWLIVGWVALLVLLGLAVFGLVTLRPHPEIALPLISSLYTVQFISWGLAPVVAFGVDETVDPARFALLPLSRLTLQRGLLVSSLIGYLPLINAVFLIGCAIALSYYWWMLPIALLCAAAQLVLCVLFSRALSTSMAGLMSGRRGRDIGVMAGFGVFVVYFGLSFLLSSGERSGADIGAGFETLGKVLGWGPPGGLAALPWQIAADNWGRTAAAVVIAVVTIGLLWWWWSAALHRSLTTVPSTTSASAPVRDAEGTAVATSTWGMVKLIADRDRVLAWRDPMRRVPWLMVAVLIVAWPLLVFRHGGAVFGVTLGAVVAGTQAGNNLGFEGSGLWLHIVAFGDRTRARGEQLGHALYALIPGTVLVLGASALLAGIKDDWRLLPAALGISLSALLGSTALACLLSAKLPYAVPQSRKSMFANKVPGQGGRTAAASLGLMLGGLAVAAPAALIAWLTGGEPVGGIVGLIVGLVIGVVALDVCTRLAAKAYLESMPEILQVVTAGDRL